MYFVKVLLDVLLAKVWYEMHLQEH
jgi:hypothetical protein